MDRKRFLGKQDRAEQDYAELSSTNNRENQIDYPYCIVNSGLCGQKSIVLWAQKIGVKNKGLDT